MKTKLNLFFLCVLMISFNTLLQAQQETQTNKLKENKLKPFAFIEGLNDSIVEKNVFMKIERLTCSDNKYKIISFTMSLMLKNGDLQQVYSQSNLITSDMKKYLSEKELEGRIWIEDIQSQSPDGKVVSLPALALKIH